MAASFEIYGRPYPLIRMNEFRFSEWVLIREATSLGSVQFATVTAEDEVDILVLFGYAVVAFWRGNPSMTRARALAAIEEWTEADVAFFADKADDEQGEDAVPLAAVEDGSILSGVS